MGLSAALHARAKHSCNRRHAAHLVENRVHGCLLLDAAFRHPLDLRPERADILLLRVTPAVCASTGGLKLGSGMIRYHLAVTPYASSPVAPSMRADSTMLRVSTADSS